MTLFHITLEWDQPIQHFFDQDDVKCVGKQRVQSIVTVVAPDVILAKLFILRAFSHREAVIITVAESPIHLFVEATGRTITSVSHVTPIGPEYIDPQWKAILDKERIS